MVLLGVLLVAMAISGTAVALPSIGADLHTAGSALNWVVAGYNLAFAVCTLVCGSLADIVGRRRVFSWCAAAFALGSLGCSAGPSIGVVDLGRIISGIGGAGVMAAGGAILAHTYSGPALTRAFALMGTMAGIGIAVGPTLSGVLIESLGWRGSFGVYTAVGAVLFVGARGLAESHAPGPHRIDRIGIATFVVGLSAVMVAVLEGPERGWADPIVITAATIGAVVLIAFALSQTRVEAPLLDPALMRNRRFVGWVLATLTTSVGFLGVLVYLPTYLQSVADMSTAAAGLTMLLLTGPVLILPVLAAALVNSGVAPRLLLALALGAVGLGNLWLSTLPVHVSAATLAGPLLCIGAGMGVTFGISDGQAMRLIAEQQTGMAAGFLNMIRGAAEALVIAAFSALLLSILAAKLGTVDAVTTAAGHLNPAHFSEQAAAFSWSWEITQYVIAAVCLALSAATLVLTRPTPEPGEPLQN
ncbi:MFS transporter [Nocardia spumae]|uniref:MFS transporter n=1 Tax=Nocardia spumae TaxID=2887190 RepID=UPI001D1559C1|nr:MFS transporter [Nocardia spumae]